jgi:hypothetical protein
LAYGVAGGLPLMILFICALWLAFRYVGESLRSRANSPFAERFLIWSLGASLFAHAVTCISVSYFEQSVVFLYLNLAIIGSLHATTLAGAREEAFSLSDSAALASDLVSEPATELPPADDGLLACAAEASLPSVGLQPR